MLKELMLTELIFEIVVGLNLFSERLESHPASNEQALFLFLICKNLPALVGPAHPSNLRNLLVFR
jgi:hypothetical protein